MRYGVDQARSIFANLGGPKEFQTFAGVRHESYVAARPQAWKRWVGVFLALQVGPRATAVQAN